MRHRQRTQDELNEVARLHEVVWIMIGNVCVCMMQLVCFAKVCEWDHARNEGNASPPEVCGFGPTKVTVYALMRHYRTQKYQVGSQQNIDDHHQRIVERNEERTD